MHPARCAPAAGSARATCAATVRPRAGRPVPTSPTYTPSRAVPWRVVDRRDEGIAAISTASRPVRPGRGGCKNPGAAVAAPGVEAQQPIPRHSPRGTQHSGAIQGGKRTYSRCGGQQGLDLPVRRLQPSLPNVVGAIRQIQDQRDCRRGELASGVNVDIAVALRRKLKLRAEAHDLLTRE